MSQKASYQHGLIFAHIFPRSGVIMSEKIVSQFSVNGVAFVAVTLRAFSKIL